MCIRTCNVYGPLLQTAEGPVLCGGVSILQLLDIVGREPLSLLTPIVSLPPATLYTGGGGESVKY